MCPPSSLMAKPLLCVCQVFVCLWKGCKVYNTPSTSQSWLQRHMLTHSGDKPFKVRNKLSQWALEEHASSTLSGPKGKSDELKCSEKTWIINCFAWTKGVVYTAVAGNISQPCLTSRSVWSAAAMPALPPRGGWHATFPATSASRAPPSCPARPSWRRSRPPRPDSIRGRSSRTNAGAPYVRTQQTLWTDLALPDCTSMF